MVGFKACLGYDYDKETRNLVINEKEAEIVRYVFNRFLDGYGSTLIGRELEEKGYLKKEGKCPACRGVGKSPDGQYECTSCKGTGKYP
jgi:hypothetical protein